MEEKNEKKEIIFEEDNTLDVPVLFEALFIKFMGKNLDYIRMSDISDRQLAQVLRSIKDDCYQHIKFAQEILKKYNVSEVEKE